MEGLKNEGSIPGADLAHNIAYATFGASSDADQIREQAGKIIKQALIELGVKTSPEQMNTLITGFVGLAHFATAEYRRAKALYGCGPEAVDKLYQKNESQVRHDTK